MSEVLTGEVLPISRESLTGPSPALSMFDYRDLPSDVDVAAVQQAAINIRARLKRSSEDIVIIGRELLHAKELLPHGSFGPWLAAEFGLSQASANNFMRVARRFGDKIAEIANLPPTAVYLLAAPSTPDSVVERVLTGAIAPTEDAIRAARQQDVDEDDAPPRYAERALTLGERVAQLPLQERYQFLATRLRELPLNWRAQLVDYEAHQLIEQQLELGVGRPPGELPGQGFKALGDWILGRFRDKEWQRQTRITRFFQRLQVAVADTDRLQIRDAVDAARACAVTMKPAEAAALAQSLAEQAGFLGDVARSLQGELATR